MNTAHIKIHMLFISFFIMPVSHKTISLYIDILVLFHTKCIIAVLLCDVSASICELYYITMRIVVIEAFIAACLCCSLLLSSPLHECAAERRKAALLHSHVMIHSSLCLSRLLSRNLFNFTHKIQWRSCYLARQQLCLLVFLRVYSLIILFLLILQRI